MELVSWNLYLLDFWRKISLFLYSINWPSFIPDWFYFVRFWAICVLYLFVNLVVTSWILKLTLFFESSRFFYMIKQSSQKVEYLENELSLFRMRRGGGAAGQKGPPTSFSPITFASVRVGSQNFLTFILIFLTDWCKISRLYLVAVPIY